MLALAGFLAPIFHWVVNGWMSNPFSRYVNRALMVSALLLLIPYFIRHWRTLGLAWNRQRSGREWLFGLGLSAGSVALVLLLHATNHSRVWQGGWSVNLIFGTILTALLVSPLEEILFRGAIQSTLIARIGRLPGWIVGAFFFAIVHFVKVPKSFNPDPVTWLSGYQSLGHALAPLVQLSTYNFTFCCLFAVGLILGLMVLRTGSLWLSIGLHTGWIIGLKWGSSLTQPAPGASDLLGSADLLSGGLTLIVLALLGLALWRFYPVSPSRTGE